MLGIPKFRASESFQITYPKLILKPSCKNVSKINFNYKWDAKQQKNVIRKETY